MDLKDILLLIDPKAPDAALGMAARLSKTHGASVRGLCLYQPPTPCAAASYAIGGCAVAAVLAEESDAVAQLLAPAHKAFLTAFRGSAHPSIWEPQPELWIEEALARTETADLVIVGRSASEPARWRELLENLVLRGGAPVLVTPQSGAPAAGLRRAVVAWNGSREAKRALDDALVFLKACPHTDLVVVEGRSGPVDSDLAGLVGHLQRHGVAATVWRVEARDEGVADALRRHCDQVGADLLVLGAYSHSRVGEQIFGGVTRALLNAPPVATLVSH